MAGFSCLQYPIPQTVGQGLSNRSDKLSIVFMPMRMKPGTSMVDTITMSTQEWKAPDIKTKSGKGVGGVDAVVDAGRLFNFEVPNDSKTIISLALPSSSITDQFSNTWQTEDIVSAAGKMGAAGAVLSTALTAVGKIIPPIFLSQYKSSEPRSFTWTFQMIPQSRAEANMCVAIINTFKLWAVPGSFADIGMIEPYIVVPKITPENSPLARMLKLFPATIQSVNVTYFDNGQVVTYTDGMPKSMQLSISLKEMLVHTRQTFGKKGNAAQGVVNSMVSGAKAGADLLNKGGE